MYKNHKLLLTAHEYFFPYLEKLNYFKIDYLFNIMFSSQVRSNKIFKVYCIFIILGYLITYRLR